MLEHSGRSIEQIHRDEWGRLSSLLVARTRRLDLAEDALAEAFAAAAARWTADGVPANPAGWLYTTAYRNIVGRLRAEAIAGRKAPLLAVTAGWAQPDATNGQAIDQAVDQASDQLGDERLHLILLCCHPALPTESRSALALRLVIGTPTEHIARLFLVPPATMAARLTRAKKKIVAAGIPLGRPLDDVLEDRLDEVCRTIYLAFTAGYSPGHGADLLRSDLASDAVQLAGILHQLVPAAPQVQATLALLTLQHARRDARQHDGALVTLARQDRSLWHRHEIRRGLELVANLPPAHGYSEELRLQSLIAAEHGRASTAADTDWSAIARIYEDLERLTGSAIVRLNRAVAVGEAHGPVAGIAVLVGLDEFFADDHRLPAVRGDLARRAGDSALAERSYRLAIDRCRNDVERAFLTGRLESLLRGRDPTD